MRLYGPVLFWFFWGGIIGLFMDETSWDKFQYYFPAVIAALFWGIIGFYAGYTIWGPRKTRQSQL